ncbi:hypothetical protein GQ43DRAFT_402093 [Delitschia confertaspora ATCC 74209]|uniref:Exocyst complex component Sec3 PIP2-binding N-terminal domain-containing protein n=1 Tax=Delitschia confertaspora ATCC 74209 TaxID=1513339 RepID=A0A9P4MP57_9PLEO|nr:hypothetical protein GQ43DRAFT_402093 [Delitschia confertaspora ATCC 74209]
MNSAFSRFGSGSSKRPSNDSTRPSNESRRPPGAPGGPSSVTSSAVLSTGSMTRAERFEDERRRITESCFAKIDTNGQLHESYITHIRVEEDAASPQLPPPPNSNPAGKKSRVVIISVRNSGRVRLHKGRENANGTFSIGKTWNMEDLSAIENWVHLVPKNKEQAERKQWAGDTGFTVTIAKPYYWKAGTAKEKEFFIASMIKIFHKYTQGMFPTLSGFDEAQKQALMSSQASPQPSQASLVQAPSISSQSPNSLMPPPSPLTTGFKRAPSHQEMRPPPVELDSRPSPVRDDRRPPPLGERRPSGDQRRPPPLGADRRPPPLGADRRPPPLGDDRRPPGSRPTTGDSERIPPRRPPTAEGERRPPPLRGPQGQSRPPTGDDDRRPPALRGAPSQGQLKSQPQMPPYIQGQDGERRPRPRPSMEQNLRSMPSRERVDMRSPSSREQMRSIPTELPGSTPPLPPTQGEPFQSSRLQPIPHRPKTPESVSATPSNMSPTRRPRQADDARSQKSVEEAIPNGTGLKVASRDPRRPNMHPSLNGRDESPRSLRPGTSQSNASSTFSRTEESMTEDRMQRTAPPERKRPPMPSSLSQQSQRSLGSDSNTEFHTPLPSPPPPSLPAALQVGRRTPDVNRETSRPPVNEETQSNNLETEIQMPRGGQPSTSDAPQSNKLEKAPAISQATQPLSFDRPTQPPAFPLPAIPKASQSKLLSPAADIERVQSAPAETKTTDSQPAESQLARTETKLADMQATSTEMDITRSQSAPPEAPPSETEDEDEHRPGLGPMVKKKPKEVANTLRKAAFAYGVFKPRAGGAADKLFHKEAKASDEPDGIRGVVPAPSRKVVNKEPETPIESDKKWELENKVEPEKNIETDTKPELDKPTDKPSKIPSVTISSPLSPSTVAGPVEKEQKSSGPEQLSKQETDARKKMRRSNQQTQNISKLGIDPHVIDDRGLEFEALLSDFGWGNSELSPRNLETVESDIKREIARVEAGSWLTHLEQKDDRVEAVEKLLDRAIAECDELEGLITLYNVELSSLNEDISFIEAQSQGLQVQTANQKLLQSELQQLVDTISITSQQLEPLRRAPIGKASGLRAIESALVLLYRALITIDPEIVQGRQGSANELAKFSTSSSLVNSELATMQALQEKRDRYLEESTMFLGRLVQFMDMTYGASFMDTKDALAKLDMNAKAQIRMRQSLDAHYLAHKALWQFSPLLLFAKEVDRSSWEKLIRMYQTRAVTIYQEEMRGNVSNWKRLARKPTGDEQDLLFTAQEKEPETLTGAARKLTVKRSQTLARGLRAASGDKDKEKEKTDRVQSGKFYAFEVFAGILNDMAPLLLTEQNFITDYFHATSSESMDFIDAVKAAPPEDRHPTNLLQRRPFEPDRVMAKHVADIMDDIFTFLPNEIQSLVEWGVKADPLQGVGILCAVDQKLLEVEDSNQDFLTRTLQKVHERLTGLFTRFVDEQIRAIEDTKVKIKKRKGVISFVKTFPHFSVAIENMLPAPHEDMRLEIRNMVDDAYQRINKAMFESLKVIAKESPAVMASHGQGDPEDKEALNYHILLIENMNHYIEELDDRSDPVLSEWKTKAGEEMEEHMNLYVDAVIRRPLGKLLEFVESTETLLALPGSTTVTIASRSSHSRSVFRKLISSYDAKEIRKGIEALKKRVDKHFGDADDPSLSRNLVLKVLKECERGYAEVLERTLAINQGVYNNEVEMDWGMGEVGAAFRR